MTGRTARRWLGVSLACVALPAMAAPSCDRLVDSGVRDCHMRLGLDSFELTDQTMVRLTPAQLDRASNQRPLRELELSPEQFGEVQGYCRSHGEIRRRIGIERGLCEDVPRE